MAANTVAAQEGALRKGVDAVGQAAQLIEARAKAVRSEGEGLRAYWTGEAATKYMALIDAWVAKANELVTSLRGLESGLQSTDRAIAATESEHASTITNIGSILG